MFVFLDIDGVLNREEDWKILYRLCDECIDNLALALKGSNARIILTSSWRKGFVSRLNQNNLPQIKNLESELMERGLSVVGAVNRNNPSRMEAIQEFLKEHPGEYVILDDDLSEYLVRPEKLYLVNSKTGLTKKDAEKIQVLLR